MKSQVISMDFVLTFIIYMLALSIFFVLVRDSMVRENSLEYSRELIIEKFEQTPAQTFLKNSKLDLDKLDEFIAQYNYDEAYQIFFKDFESTKYNRIDYCIYLQKSTHNSTQIIRNFAAGKKLDYPIIMGTYGKTVYYCGQNSTFIFENTYPYCNKKEVMVLTKPVIVKNEIINLKIMSCAE